MSRGGKRAGELLAAYLEVGRLLQPAGSGTAFAVAQVRAATGLDFAGLLAEPERTGRPLPDLAGLLAAWWGAVGAQALTAGEVVTAGQEDDALGAALAAALAPNGRRGDWPRALGYRLRRCAGRTFGEFRLLGDRPGRNGVQWSMQRVEGPAGL